MKQGRRYYRTEDLKPYIVIGEQIITPIHLTYTQTYYVLVELGNPKNLVRVFDGINMGTTRDWATTEKMAVANKIKLLENEIVQLSIRR